jgi:polyisoprenoid-binding protein YceI
MKSLLLALITAALSMALVAPALAAPATYTFEPNHTFVRFSYNHMGFSTQEQRFNKVTGTVTYDPEGKSASVNVVIDTKSIDTGSDLFQGHIQGADYLDTTQYPTATFHSTAVKFEGDQPVSIQGELTLKGVTKPVTLMITHFKHGMNMMKKDAIGAMATGTVKRTDFNMGKNAPMVGDEVTLTISLEAMTS